MGGSNGNNFVNNVTWGEITDYQALTQKIQGLMEKRDPAMLSDPQLIIDEIFALASGTKKTFRNLVGEDTKSLKAMRDALPLEEYLEKINAMYV